MQDPELRRFLPEVPEHSIKLPERDFFFGVLYTLRTQYMKDVICNGRRELAEFINNYPERQKLKIMLNQAQNAYKVIETM